MDQRKNDKNVDVKEFDELLSTFWTETELVRAHGLDYKQRRQHQANANEASLMLKVRYGYET